MRNRLHLSKRAWIIVFCALAGLLALVVVFHDNPRANPTEELYKKLILCGVIFGACLIFIRFYDKLTTLPFELFDNRKLIWRLAKNDFRKRYATSYLGAFWALVHPVVTVVMYWFVFQNFLGQTGRQEVAAGIDLPYVVFLTAGLVPWFYFSEAWSNGTTSLLEYNYLVKKVVFKISILPMIKVIAATFVHLFFVLILLVLAACYGIFPTVYTIQLLYYSFCLFVLVLGMSYVTCSLVIFFGDLQQIIAIILQVGMWATPILWNINFIADKPWLVKIIKLNPLVYIVNGYRSSLVEKTWFFYDFFSTVYFWIVTVVIFGIGALLFKRLKPQFADVM